MTKFFRIVSLAVVWLLVSTHSFAQERSGSLNLGQSSTQYTEEIHREIKSDSGSLSLDGAASILEQTSNLSSSYDLTPTGFEANASGNASYKIFSGQAEAHGHEQITEDLTVDGRASADGFVGVDTSFDSSVALDSHGAAVTGSGTAFLGGKVHGEAGGSVFSNFLGIAVTGQVHGEASYGAGIGGDFVFSFRDGVFTVGGGISATLGLGLGAGGKVQIDASVLLGRIENAFFNESDEIDSMANTMIEGIVKGVEDGRYVLSNGTNVQSMLESLRHESILWAKDPIAYKAEHGGVPVVSHILQAAGLSHNDQSTSETNTPLPGPGDFARPPAHTPAVGNGSGGGSSQGGARLQPFR